MRIRKVVRATDFVLKWLLVSLMALAVINVLWQVFTRFIMDAPSGFTEELARFLLIWVGILGAGYAAGQRVHLALELLPERLTGERKRRLNIVIEACVFVFALSVMVIGGSRLVYIQLMLGQTSPSLALPMGFVYSVVPLSGLLIMFYNVVYIMDEMDPESPLRKKRAHEEREADPEDLFVD